MRPRRRRDGSIRWQQQDVWLPDQRRWRCRNCPNVSQRPWKFYCCMGCREAYLVTVPEFWAETRRRIIRRDRYRCTLCGSGAELEVDHIKPVALFPDLEFDDSNLRTLCHACHIKHGAKPRAGRGRAANAPGQQRLAIPESGASRWRGGA